MTLRKLGPHVINQMDEAMAWVRVAPIVKSLNRVDTLQAATRAKVLIYRHYFPQQNLYADPHAVADAILADLGGWRDPRLMVEVYNEIGGVNSAEHLAFLQRVVPILHAAGVRVCGPSWATGDYEQGHWELFRVAGWAGLDAIAVHGYWSHEKGPTPWNALRWQQFWQPGDPDVVNTECGEDRVRDGDNGEYIGSGWRLSGATEAEYLAEHVGYDGQLQQDAHCLGAVSFTAGPTSDWQDYNADPIARAAAALCNGGGTMSLQEQFPNEWAAWIAAGGAENNFRKHALAANWLPATPDAVRFLGHELRASIDQLSFTANRLQALVGSIPSQDIATCKVQVEKIIRGLDSFPF